VSTEDDARPSRDARGLLLDKVVAHLGEHGSSDLTLRSVAAAVGTSHRMLIYHFGSLDGMVAAVVGEVERRQRAAFTELAALPGTGIRDVAEAFWRRLRSPELRPLERLFFELYTRGLVDQPQVVTERLVLPWLAGVAESLTARGFPPAQARALARLGQAVTRGLLLDLLASDDEAAVDEAMEQYISLVTALEQGLGTAATAPAQIRATDGPA
jgi:AcrR family transcriptional regulator